MKLLLDENLSRRLLPFLQHDYPDSNQVVLLGMESASDREVWQKAKDDDYLILTFHEQPRHCEPQPRHCERSEAIQGPGLHGLPRYAFHEHPRHCERSAAIHDFRTAWIATACGLAMTEFLFKARVRYRTRYGGLAVTMPLFKVRLCCHTRHWMALSHIGERGAARSRALR